MNDSLNRRGSARRYRHNIPSPDALQYQRPFFLSVEPPEELETMDKRELLGRLRPLFQKLEDLLVEDCADGDEELRPHVRTIANTAIMAAHGTCDVVVTAHRLGTPLEALMVGDSPRTIRAILVESGLARDRPERHHRHRANDQRGVGVLGVALQAFVWNVSESG